MHKSSKDILNQKLLLNISQPLIDFSMNVYINFLDICILCYKYNPVAMSSTVSLCSLQGKKKKGKKQTNKQTFFVYSDRFYLMFFIYLVRNYNKKSYFIFILNAVQNLKNTTRCSLVVCFLLLLFSRLKNSSRFNLFLLRSPFVFHVTFISFLRCIVLLLHSFWNDKTKIAQSVYIVHICISVIFFSFIYLFIFKLWTLE